MRKGTQSDTNALSRESKTLAQISLFIVLCLGLTLFEPNYAQDLPQDYLNAHNKARAEAGAGNLTWDDKVAAYAQNYANQRMTDCKLVHSVGPYGENIAWGSGNLSGTEAVSLWVSEKANYNPKNNTCMTVCEHYIKVVWQYSRYLGCSRVRCKNGGTFISCNYDPPWNYLYTSPYELNQSAPTPKSVTPYSPSPPPLNSTGFGEGRTNSASPPPLINSPGFGAGRPNADYTSRGKKIVLLLIGGAIVLLVASGIIWVVLRRQREQNESAPILDMPFGDEFEKGMGPKKFSYHELASATNNFGERDKLGDGGFGDVYKGFLRELNSFVAVKRISKKSKQGSKEYVAEVKIISRLRHKNTVKLIGWCHEKELILVYEFMPNGSLDTHLFKGKTLLTWDVRYKIVLDLASGLLYLHEEGDQCVLHRDIKSSNIMLDAEFNAKLGDFGLARLVDHEKGSQTTTVAGTIGYMAPECLLTRKASKESDVFSFGIVALEVACGRRSIEQREEEARVSLVAWAWESYGKEILLDVVDKKLCMNFDRKQMESLLIVGLWCAHPDRNLRPSIRQAIRVLNFESPLPILPTQMPIAKYDVPTTLVVNPSSGHQSLMSLTVPR